MKPELDELSYNFLVAGGGANSGAADHDDGSAFYYDHHNFMVYGGHKSNWGHAKRSESNLMAFALVYTSTCMRQFPFLPPSSPGGRFAEAFVNNTCILGSLGDVYLDLGSDCSPGPTLATQIMLANNSLLAPPGSGTGDVKCGRRTLSFSDWVASGSEPGTTMGPVPPTQVILGWARELLTIPAAAAAPSKAAVMVVDGGGGLLSPAKRRTTAVSGSSPPPYDVGVFGSTVCAVAACVAAARMNASCAFFEPTAHIFGMTAGGLSGVDLAMQLGGIAREIFGNHTGPNFPPSALNRTLHSLLTGAGPGVIDYRKRCGDITGIERAGLRLTAIHFASCPPLEAAVFLDCSYEGDLLRLSNTSYVVGREASRDYNESLAGVNAGLPWGHGAYVGVSPWVDDTNTTLLPTVVSVVPQGVDPSSSDNTVMAMNYRLCLTNNASNRRPFDPPPGYTPAATEVLRRFFAANAASLANASLLSLFLVRQLGEAKIDVNDAERLPNTADMPFLQSAYPLANYTERAAIGARHEWYIRAAWEFLRSDPVVPPAIRAEAAEWGLPLDEFVETGGFPPQLYVRESVRLRGAVVMAQGDVFGSWFGTSNASVGLSKWLVDIHNVLNMAAPPSLTGRGWEVTGTGLANTKHGVWQLTEVPFGALTPRRGEATNLLVPVCASFTHVAFSTYRLEPQYAIFGHSAGVAAVLAGRSGVAVQDLPIGALQAELRSQGQLIDAKPPPPPTPGGSELRLVPCNGAPPPHWSVYPADGSLRRTGGGAPLCVSVWGFSNSTGEKLVSAACHTDRAPHNQAFDVVGAAGGGGFLLRSRMSGLCASRSGGAVGDAVLQGACTSEESKWKGFTEDAAWETYDGSGLCVSDGPADE